MLWLKFVLMLNITILFENCIKASHVTHWNLLNVIESQDLCLKNFNNVFSKLESA